ncbi:MAG: hypothetical protein ACREC0_01965 [Methylocella sp.]
MKSKLFGYLAATALGAAIALPTPTMARGGFGGGGFHGGGGFGGMRGRGMHFGGMPGGFHGGMVTGRSVYVPGGNRFARAPFAGRSVFGNRFEDRFEHHHRFRNFVFVGALGWPYYYDYGYGGCWRQAWTSYGWQWVNVCNDYGDYGY